MPLSRISNQARKSAELVITGQTAVSPRVRAHTPRTKSVAQRGFIMVEMLLAVAIVGTAMLATVSAFSSASRTANHVSESGTAKWLATSQIESIRTAPFVTTPGTYPAVSAPMGYVLTNSTSAVTGGDANIQVVTVGVALGGDTIFETSSIKVNR